MNTWVKPISTGVEISMVTLNTNSPSIIHNYCVFNRATSNTQHKASLSYCNNNRIQHHAVLLLK